MDILSVFTPSSGIDAELTVGDKSEEINAQVGNTTNNTAEQVGDRVETQSNVFNNIPPWVMLLMIIGWMAPTPSNMWRGITGVFKKKEKTL